MDVVINIEKKFEKDRKKLKSQELKAISDKINQLIEIIREGKITSPYITKLHKIRIGPDMDSSIYTMKINMELRLILTSEDDPLFNEHIITLLRVVRHKDLEKTFMGIAESINQSLLIGGKNNG